MEGVYAEPYTIEPVLDAGKSTNSLHKHSSFEFERQLA